MPVELVSPAALLLLWLLLVVYALHRRRRARRQVTLPSLHLLPETTLVGSAAGGDPQDLLLLAVRLLVALAAIAALAGPMATGIGVPRVVVVIDTSASMAAPDPDDPQKSRLEVAMAQARAEIDELSPERVLVIAAGIAPRVVEGWIGVAELEGVLSKLAPEEGPSELALALTDARALAGKAGAVRVFTDDEAPIPGNRAVAALTFRPYLHIAERGAFLVTVRRGPQAEGETDDDVFVRIDMAGKRVGTVRVSVPSGGEGSAWVEYRGGGGAPARASLLGDDPLAADDHAVCPVPRLTRRKIALVTPGNPELERALRAWPRGVVEVRPPGRHPPADLLVLDGESEVGDDRAAVLLRPPGEVKEVTPVGAPVDRPGLAAAISHGKVKASPLPPLPPGGRVLLADDRDAPLLWVRSSPGPARAALAFDPGANGLADDPLHAVFWADLLTELLLPEDGGCKRVPVGASPGVEGPLTRVGLYELDEGCFVASVPDRESRPTAVVRAGERAPDQTGRRDLGGAFAAAGLLLLLLEWLLARRTRLGRDTRRRPLVLRLVTLVLLAVAIMPPAWGSDRASKTAWLVDGSPSVPAAARAAAAAQIVEWAEDNDETYVFGGSTQWVRRAELSDKAGQGTTGGTDLAGALIQAGREVGPGGSVVMWTDGRSTVGDSATHAAALLRRRRVTVHVAGAWGGGTDTWIERVNAPARVRVSESAVVTAVLRRVGEGRAGTVVFRLDGREVAREDADLTAVSLATVATRVRFDKPGRRELRVELSTGFGRDASEQNDAGGTLVHVIGTARSLVVSDHGPGGLVDDALTALGHETTRIAPAELSPDAAQLARYDLVVLDDVGVSAMPEGATGALARYASSGGGLVVGGGPRSFGPGGYPGTPLDGVLPLKSDARKAGGRMAVVLLLDKSGSMGGDEGGWERLLLAKATLRALLKSFRRPDDRVGVLGYDSGPVVILPMTQVSDVKAESIRTGTLHPAGGTNPVPALRQAAKWLGPVDKFPTRHIIIVSDGRFPGMGAQDAVRELRNEGITTSTVGVGTGADERRLRAIASAGGGDHAGVTELTDMPGIIARHMMSAVQTPLLEGAVVVEAGPDLPGILADPPVRWIGLSGLVRTGLHNEAHLWLSAGTGEPLLAGRRVGAGRAVAFASQLVGDWTAAWQGFDDGGRLFAAAVAWATRRERGGWEVAVEELHDGQIRVVLDAVDGGGRPVSELTCRVEVDLPGGGRGQSVMSAVAPGRYRAVLDAPGTGVISATVLVGADVVGRAAMLRLSAAELRDRGDDLAALEAIAEAGGGEVLSRGGPPPSRTPAPPGSGPAQRGWPMLLAIALYMAYLRDEGRLAQGVAEAGRRL